MSDLLAARSQMAVSLAFHIVFAMVGIAMPVLMVVAERRWQVTGQDVYLELARRWAKGTAILFAVGAVSGTVLSFELGLLWPGFMKFAGPIIGMPFSLEGFAFFPEAIFLGVYLYGWGRISPRAHLAAGILVALSGALSGIFVVIANAWMNAPTGFDLVNGGGANVDPLRAVLNPAALPQALHMTLAAYAATGVAVAGIHAVRLLEGPSHAFDRRAPAIALLVGGPGAARRMAQRGRGAPVLPDHGGSGHVPGGRHTVGGVARLAQGGPRARSLADARAGRRHAVRLSRDRGGVDGDRAGPPAVGDLRRPAHRRRGDADARAHRPLPRVYAAVLLPRRDRGVAALPADRSQPARHRVVAVLYAPGSVSMTLADALAGVVVVALNCYAVLGGADFGGGVWALFAAGPRRERQRALVAEAIGPVWEANHVWLILAIVLLFTCLDRKCTRLNSSHLVIS